MNWTLPALWRNVAEAWSAENWPYTLAFWIAVAAVGWWATRRSPGKKDETL